MNCTDLFLTHAKSRPSAMALWTPQGGVTSFGELLEMAGRAQGALREAGVKPGDPVLLVDTLGPRLYAQLVAVLALGATAILVEPWMPVAKIDRVIRLVQPRVFLTHWLGRVWAMRIPAARSIPIWLGVNKAARAPSRGLHLESVEGETPAIITFTSGTTGNPKGVVRHQSYLVDQYEVLTRSLGLGDVAGPDLCIFANFALANLASGRGTVLVPPKWRAHHLKAIDNLPAEIRPESMTCGPAFLMRLMASAKVSSLKSIHVGGALSDCATFEAGFAHWPDAHWTHLYGSSEAEPVATADAHDAVKKSRARGLFQTLSIGTPVADIRATVEENGAWVTGPHVCPRYVGNDEENNLYKRRDEQGNVWHFMGDRVREDADGWWYAGRSGQNPDDFALEQKIYSYLQSSRAFVQRDRENRIYLVGEVLKERGAEIQKQFPEIHAIAEVAIQRDPRHRARIDRKKSLKKGAPWLVG